MRSFFVCGTTMAGGRQMMTLKVVNIHNSPTNKDTRIYYTYTPCIFPSRQEQKSHHHQLHSQYVEMVAEKKKTEIVEKFRVPLDYKQMVHFIVIVFDTIVVPSHYFPLNSIASTLFFSLVGNSNRIFRN